MFAGRFLVRYDPHGLFRRDLAPRLICPRAIRWCRWFFFKNIAAMPRRVGVPVAAARERRATLDRLLPGWEVRGRLVRYLLGASSPPRGGRIMASPCRSCPTGHAPWPEQD